MDETTKQEAPTPTAEAATTQMLTIMESILASVRRLEYLQSQIGEAYRQETVKEDAQEEERKKLQARLCRQNIASAVLNGLLCGHFSAGAAGGSKTLEEEAVHRADQLLAELAKTEKEAAP